MWVTLILGYPYFPQLRQYPQSTGGNMQKASRFVIWICSKFNREQIEIIVKELSEILKNKNPEIKPKDQFKEKYPNYRNFSVDPKPPLTEPTKKKFN